jgi:hypothetical protein
MTDDWNSALSFAICYSHDWEEDLPEADQEVQPLDRRHDQRGITLRLPFLSRTRMTLERQEVRTDYFHPMLR